MNVFKRILLGATLALMIFGLSAHSFPAISLCKCITTPADDAGASDVELCLVCQMQSGVHVPPIPTYLHHDITIQTDNRLELYPLERVFPVLHPPIA